MLSPSCAIHTTSGLICIIWTGCPKQRFISWTRVAAPSFAMISLSRCNRTENSLLAMMCSSRCTSSISSSPNPRSVTQSFRSSGCSAGAECCASQAVCIPKKSVTQWFLQFHPGSLRGAFSTLTSHSYQFGKIAHGELLELTVKLLKVLLLLLCVFFLVCVFQQCFSLN